LLRDLILFPQNKFHNIVQVFQYNSSVSTQSHDILANFVASSVQWYKCFGTLRPRGNTKKPKTPNEMIARSQLKDSDYSDNGSDVTFSGLRCHKKRHKTRKASDDLKARLWICKEVAE